MHSRNPRWIAESLVKQVVKRLREIPEIEMAYLILKKYRPEALSSLREDVATILTGALRDALGPNATPFHRVEELLALARRSMLNAGDMRDAEACDAAAVEVGVLEYLGRLIECLKRLVPGEWILDLSHEDAMTLWQNVPFQVQAELRALRPKDGPPGFMFSFCGVDIVQGERGVEGTDVAEVGTPTLFAVELDDADMRALRPVLAKYGFTARENSRAFMHKTATVEVDRETSSILDARLSIQIEALPIRR